MQQKLLVVTELFSNVTNDFDPKKSARYSRVLVVTELVVSGTQCKDILTFVSIFAFCVFGCNKLLSPES